MAKQDFRGSARHKEKQDRWVRIEVKRALSMLDMPGTVLRGHESVMWRARQHLAGGSAP
ncbi:hypothetical protein [Mongoliimonas terrestris]|uniref:hypothetical protein n=1 Tax=Mongoliimonas terrestris TaxID=1709001 RepID=UPI000A44E4D2|nr:hypothetical protein [Mongoliimonas terrestris]